MSQYPVIDEAGCTGCESCIDLCPNGVFELDSAKNLVKVANPEKCVNGCTLCTNVCLSEAISIVTE